MLSEMLHLKITDDLNFYCEHSVDIVQKKFKKKHFNFKNFKVKDYLINTDGN